ncbi:MAG: hypothetical protein ACUVRS_12105 [Armatimonadota bacterium]
MARRIVITLFAVLLVTAVTSSACFSQVQVPTAYVKGSGAIKVGEANIGMFEVNVVKSGSVVSGGIKFTEVSPDSTKPVNVIISRVVKALCVQGNFATITAEGLWNRMPAQIKVECLDDNPSGDWFHITAKPINSPLPIIYDAAGGLIKGDIVVFSQSCVYGYTRGYGAIRTPGAGVGRFSFKAELTNAGVKGWLSYVDFNPSAASVVARPKVVIYVPQIESLELVGNTAVMKGKGTLNGRPVIVWAKAVDNSSPVAPTPVDEFYITARPVSADAFDAGYEAGGPLIFGDIVVVILRTNE